MTRVAIVDDQTLVRHGIRSLLALSADIEVVAEGEDGDDALAIVARGDVDVLLLDLRMPRRDGIAALEAMRERGDAVPVLVLTTFDDDELVLRAVRAGARGYLLKDVTLDQLLGAVSTLAAGGTMLQPTLTDRLLRAVAAGRSAPDGALGRAEPLTARELDILRLVAAGYSNNEIASALHLAPGTVKNHVTAVLLKLGVRDRTRAVLRALDLGLLAGPPPAERGPGGPGRSSRSGGPGGPGESGGPGGPGGPGERRTGGSRSDRGRSPDDR
ncbi:response regulator transcription factor [Cellulomonas sp. ATA003]|uniref:response regulator transcription factor n=1 Tax=Cellulomonas sp. ATA003 TaxID=3073064 RepID=UPI0028733F6D|nr:response regulator transcription factor [Cellulomonas sp. ATA003]WNB85537.1 response regulator transcription factor [Cellulomonas sp. ATA003]